MSECPKTSTPSPAIVLVRSALLVVLVGLLFRRELAGAVLEAENSSEWTHAFVMPMVGLAYVLSRKEDLRAAVTEGSAWGYPFIIGGVFVRVASILGAQFGYARLIGMLCCAWGVVLAAAGRGVARICLPLILMICCCLPLTERVMGPKTLFLQRCSIQAAAVVLNTLPGLQARVNGMTIDLQRPGNAGPVGLAEQRFGLFGLPACCLLCLYIVFVKRRPIWEIVLLGLVSAAAVPASNVIRIVVWAAMQTFGAYRPTDSMPRNLSLAASLLTTGGILATACWLLPKLGRLMERLCTIEDDDAPEENGETPRIT